MPRRADGSYERPAGTPYVAGADMEAAPFNNEMQDLATALGEMIAVDGTTPAEGRIPFRQGVSTKLINKMAADSEVSFSGKLHTRGKILSFGRNGAHRAYIILPRGAARDTTPTLTLPDTGGELQVGGAGAVPSGVQLLWGTAPPAGWTLQAVDSGGLMAVVGGDTAGIQGTEAGEYFDNVMAEQYMTMEADIGVRDHEHRLDLYGNGQIEEHRYDASAGTTPYSVYRPTDANFPVRPGEIENNPLNRVGNNIYLYVPSILGDVDRISGSYSLLTTDNEGFDASSGQTFDLPAADFASGNGVFRHNLNSVTAVRREISNGVIRGVNTLPNGTDVVGPDRTFSGTFEFTGGGTPETPLPPHVPRPQWGFLKMQRHLAPPMPENVTHAHPIDFRVNYWGFVLAQKD